MRLQCWLAHAGGLCVSSGTAALRCGPLCMQLLLHVLTLLPLCRFAGMKYDTEQFNVAGRSIKTGLLGECGAVGQLLIKLMCLPCRSHHIGAGTIC